MTIRMYYINCESKREDFFHFHFMKYQNQSRMDGTDGRVMVDMMVEHGSTAGPNELPPLLHFISINEIGPE
jgi:hypothetical protein